MLSYCGHKLTELYGNHSCCVDMLMRIIAIKVTQLSDSVCKDAHCGPNIPCTRISEVLPKNGPIFVDIRVVEMFIPHIFPLDTA